MGINGGLVAIDTNLSNVNTEYSKKLNSDLYTNLAVRHDTLFAEKYNKIYYLSQIDTTWLPYQLNDPVALFDILFEDDNYVFYSISKGEFGTILFVLDKKINKLRVASYENDPQCIYYQDSSYFIVSCLRHGSGTSSYEEVLNVNQLDIISETKQNEFPFSTLISHFRNLPVSEYPKFKYNYFVKKNSLKTILTIEYGVMLTNAFFINNQIYHFTDYNTFNQSLSYDKTYITQIVNKNIYVVDSIDSFNALRTRTYDNYTIIEGYSKDGGYYLSNSDSLFYIKFNGTPDYKIKREDTTVVINNELADGKIFQETYTYEPHFKRELSFRLDTNLMIHSTGNRYLELHFLVGNSKRKILLNNRWSILNKAFKHRENWYLYFLGKYGLIEIYDLERFINEYSKK